MELFLEHILHEKKHYLTLLFWILAGIFTGPFVYVIVAVNLYIMQQKGDWVWLLLGFFFILTLSDSREASLQFAKNLRIIILLSISFFYLINFKEEDSFSFFKPFIPFFLIAFIALINSPTLFYGFQKTLSYLILLVFIPAITRLLLKYERTRFLYNLILLGTIIITIGLIAIVLVPSLVYSHGERFRGLLGNPNGLGIYLFLFLALFTYIQSFQRNLFTSHQIFFIYALIIISIILTDSRGAMFSSILFIAAWQLLKRDPIIGFIAMILIFVSYQVIMTNFVEIVTALGLEDYFRLETFSTGSGRLVAAKVAWKHIPDNYWFSKGFTYNETILAQYREYFLQHGHEGHFHNSWLTMWLDTGLIGLILFCFGWVMNFIKGFQFTPLVWAVFFGMILSNSVESWLTASLNPFTIQLVIILTMLSDKNFYESIEEQEIVSSD